MDILVAFAHPDDETVFLGGTAALLSERGARVHCRCATRGEGGETGEPPQCAAHELGDVRSQELACAVRALGGASLDFLGFVDPPVDSDGNGRAFAPHPSKVAERVAEVALSCQAQAVISHGSGGEYGHPAHRLMNAAAWQAVRLLLPMGIPLYTFSADFPEHPRRMRSANRDDRADFVIDISVTLARKRTAYRCHGTQGALFVRRASREAGRPVPLDDVVIRLESLHRAWPPHTGRPEDPLAEFLRTQCADALWPYPNSGSGAQA